MDAQSDLAHRDTFAGMSDRDGGVFLHLHRDQNDPLCGSVDLCGLPVEVLSRLRLSNPAPEDWPAWFSVFVGAAIEADEAALPAVLGRYSVVEDCVRFTPKYAWMRGTSYQIRINLAPLVVGTRPQPIRWLSFSVPGDAAAAATIVSGVFPSGDCLPENTLRFYIHFSAAMRSGSSQAHVSLVGPDGRSIEGAFLHLVTELWDPDMRRLTVLLHPGRIKRGVGANVAVGPALLAGQRYSIVVGNGMLDGSGRPLRQSFQKSFIAAPAVRRPIDPLQWTVSLPAPGTRQPLVLSFPNSLDHAILSHSLCVVGGTGEPMIGTVDIDASDRRWRFLPDTIWQSGPHQVLIDQRLEDVCGNTISAAFDIEGQVGGARARSRHPYALPFHLG